PADLSDSLGVLVGAMTGGHDLFREGPFEVRTPVGHHSVTAVRRVPFAAVADDRMVGKRFGHWKPQNRQEQGRSRAKKTNAVRRRNKGTSHIIAHIAQDFGLFVSPPENAKRELDEVGTKTGDRL